MSAREYRPTRPRGLPLIHWDATGVASLALVSPGTLAASLAWKRAPAIATA